MSVRVIGPRDPKVPGEVVNTTSNSAEAWSKGLSPFYVGPVPLYEGAVVREARTMEGLWQYSKVYACHLTSDGEPSEAYFGWAAEGWSAPRARRYPMGKGATPAYTWWAGEKLSYLEARKRVYVPTYTRAVATTAAFARLWDLYRENGRRITLWDFDGRDGVTVREALDDPKRSFGHAFALAALLEHLESRSFPGSEPPSPA